MQIVLTKQVADELATKYTVLELDTIQVEGYGSVPAYCILEPEAVVFEMSSLADNVLMHQQLIEAIKQNDTTTAMTIADAMQGRFAGHMDTFYQNIVERITNTGATHVIVPA